MTVAVSIDNTDLNLAHNTATVTFTFSDPPPLLSQVNATKYTATFAASANTDIANASVSVNQISPVTFSSAVATFYETTFGGWPPSQMIDGIFIGPNGPAGGGDNG